MPNWGHLFTNFAYHVGLALWIGGTIALGALVAPQLFRSLPRPQAGGIFGPILRRFSRLRVFGLLLAIAAAGVKYVVWERGGNAWIAIRWGALTLMAAALVYEIAFLERAMEQLRSRFAAESGADDPHRQAFGALHRRAERLMRVSLLAALAALLLS